MLYSYLKCVYYDSTRLAAVRSGSSEGTRGLDELMELDPDIRECFPGYHAKNKPPRRRIPLQGRVITGSMLSWHFNQQATAALAEPDDATTLPEAAVPQIATQDLSNADLEFPEVEVIAQSLVDQPTLVSTEDHCVICNMEEPPKVPRSGKIIWIFCEGGCNGWFHKVCLKMRREPRTFVCSECTQVRDSRVVPVLGDGRCLFRSVAVATTPSLQVFNFLFAMSHNMLISINHEYTFFHFLKYKLVLLSPAVWDDCESRPCLEGDYGC